MVSRTFDNMFLDTEFMDKPYEIDMSIGAARPGSYGQMQDDTRPNIPLPSINSLNSKAKA